MVESSSVYADVGSDGNGKLRLRIFVQALDLLSGGRRPHMFRWIIAGKLAGGHRPRATRQRLGQVSKASVDAWLKKAQVDFSIRSIICLMDGEELLRYQALSEDLLSYYRKHGFSVAHIPAANHLRPRISKSNLKKVWKAYKRLSKPVLVHCSIAAPVSAALEPQ